jgi:threonyl-tRNA synthetase
MWDQGQKALAEVLDRRGLRYEPAAGEGAFYGPKIDVQILDPVGRESTLSTVQLDFYQPRQFGLSYVAADQSLQRPVMIHRSIVGSLERLVAHLTEVHAGAFPTWMAPVQVVVLPVTCQQLPVAASLLRRFIDAGLRAEISDPDRGTLGARIRSHRLVPYQAIVGARETADETVSLRLRSGLALDPIPARDAADHILAAADHTLAAADPKPAGRARRAPFPGCRSSWRAAEPRREAPPGSRRGRPARRR